MIRVIRELPTWALAWALAFAFLAMQAHMRDVENRPRQSGNSLTCDDRAEPHSTEPNQYRTRLTYCSQTRPNLAA